MEKEILKDRMKSVVQMWVHVGRIFLHSINSADKSHVVFGSLNDSGLAFLNYYFF
jgi:hypothetical protein